MEFSGNSEEKLHVLEDDTAVFIGRKKSLHSKYGMDGSLLIGKSVEKQNFGKKIYLDALSPHVVFISGARGSGKSYSLGVMAEELVLKNPNVSCVIIDPIGIFWSMKYPNKEEKELKELIDWGLEPQGVERTRVFVPLGLKGRVPKQTYDKLFTIKPKELTVDEWCLTFGIERFSVTGLLLEKSLEKARERYKNYSLDELTKIIEKDKELTSKERGYKQDSRRALVSRFEAAKSWGIFSKEGTSLAEICRRGWVSVIDISFLEENVASLVIGLLARKILDARKLVTRKSAMEKYTLTNLEEIMDVDIPPTWLFIDEAHTLIPSGSHKTAATDSLIEYVKQGRRPGCSLVFATQQPSAIDIRVLSQLDLLFCHKLVFDEDLKAVMKRMPTLLPKEYERTRFLKTLPIGIALLGDRSDETSRAFNIKIRPRFSQHEGRETKTIEMEHQMDLEQIQNLLVDLIYKKLQDRKLLLSRVEEICETIAERYRVKKVNTDTIIGNLQTKGAVLEEGYLKLPGVEEIVELEEEIEGGPAQGKAFQIVMTKAQAIKLAEKKYRKKKKLGFFGKEEKITDICLEYEPVYKINYNLREGSGYKALTCFIGSDQELYYYDKKLGLKKTEDMDKIIAFSDKKLRVLNALKKTNNAKKIIKMTKFTPQAVSRYLRELAEENFVVKKDDKYLLKYRLDVPESIHSSHFTGIDEKLNLTQPQQGVYMERAHFDKKEFSKIPSLYGKVKMKDHEVILKPVWKVTLQSPDKGSRFVKIDAV